MTLNLTWVLPSKTPMERSLRGQKNPSKGLRCNYCSRMLGKQLALNPVSRLFKCLHRLTSIKEFTLAHTTKKISQSNWGNPIQAGRPCGVVDDVALFSSLQTSR